MIDSIEERLKDVESVKVMVDLNLAAMEEKNSSLKYKVFILD